MNVLLQKYLLNILNNKEKNPFLKYMELFGYNMVS